MWTLSFLVLFLVMLSYLWFRSEPSWAIALSPQEVRTTPGSVVSLTAQVTRAASAEDGWTWTWTSPSGRLQGNGPTIQFSSGDTGAHRVSVTVRSPRGTTQSAEAIVTVQPAMPARALQFREIAKPTLPFRITGVSVDKPEVCRGERTVVRVRATHDEGKVGRLVPVINGRVGWAVSVLVPGATPGNYKIPVRVGDPSRNAPGEPVEYQQTSASIVLKDCDAPSSLWLTSRQPSSIEESVWLRATWLDGNSQPRPPGREPVSYVWDFGDGSPKVRTQNPEVRHLFPSEEERGPGKRVFSYLVNAELLDPTGQTLADGMLDITLRNRIEELKYTDHRLQLRAEFHPHPRIDSDGSAVMDVLLKNLDPEETARLTDMEFRRVSCSANGATQIEPHAVAEVFDGASVPPLGTISGKLRWPNNDSNDVCHIDVSIKGISQPGGLTVGGTFSMRVRLDQDQGVEQIRDSAQAAEIKKAMSLLNKRQVTLEDLARLVETGQISESVLHPPGSKKAVPGSH
jgi:hypothetical protein